MQQLRSELHEENYLRSEALGGGPGAPVGGIHADLEMDEARSQRCRHAVGDAAVAIPVTARDQRGAFRQLVFAHLAVEDELIKGGLHHRHRRRQFLQVDEPTVGVVGGRQEGRGRPAGPVGAVAPGDAAQIDGVEQERADVDILAAGIGGDLLSDLTLGTPRRPPHHGGLASLD